MRALEKRHRRMQKGGTPYAQNNAGQEAEDERNQLYRTEQDELRRWRQWLDSLTREERLEVFEQMAAWDREQKESA